MVTVTNDWSPIRDKNTPVLLALMLSMALIAMDATILATAVPSVVAELGSYQQFPWLFSIYLLGQAVTVPVYGKLADMFGRKPIALFGVGLFVLASLACGFAPTMGWLIGFRALQGIGAGAIGPMAMTITSDLYTLQQRGRVQGYLSSVWAIASVLGPTLGGLFAQLGVWRWIFWLNVPLGLVAIVMIRAKYHEHLEPRRHKVDYLGAVVITAALTAIILGTLEGGNSWPWASWQTLAIYGFGIVMLIVLRYIEGRAAEPILEFDLLRRPLIVTTTIAALAVGAVTTGVSSFAPTYLQVTLGLAPIVAGLCVATMTLGWPLSSANSSRVYMTRGFRFSIVLGSAIAFVTFLVLAFLVRWPSAVTIAVGGFVGGIGMGFAAAPATIAAQNSVGWGQRASVTAINNFARSAGSAVGVALFGALSNSAVAAHGGNTSREALIDGTQLVFIGVVVATVVMILAGFGMPKGKPVDRSEVVAEADLDV